MRALGVLLLTAIALSWPGSAHVARAQPRPAVDNGTVTAGVVNDLSFPQVQLPIWVTGADGLPVADLLPTDLVVTENDVALPADRLRLAPSAGEPVSIVIAVDRSADLQDWFSSLDAANALLAQMRPGDKAALIVYDAAVDVLTTLTSDTEAVRSALDNVAPPAQVPTDDPSRPNEYVDAAVRRAMQFFETEASGRRAVVLLANGADDLVLAGQLGANDATAILGESPAAVAGAAPSTLQRLTQLARANSAPIHVYAYGPNAAMPELALLAVGSGGRALAVSAAQDLAGNTQVLPSLLRQGYLLEYRSTLPADDATHVLGVRLVDSEPMERTFVANRSVVEVTITTPAPGSTQSGAFPVGVQVSASSEIVGMSFTLENGEVITTTTRQVGGIIWDSSTTASGDRKLTVAAQDSAGNAGSAVLPITIVPPITVQATIPFTQATAGHSITVTTAVDSFFPDVVVELFLGNQQVGLASSAGDVTTFLVDTTDFVPGRYTLTVRASNNAGYSAVDATNVLQILPPPRMTPPAVVAAGVWARAWGPWILLGLLLLAALAIVGALIGRALARRQREAALRAAQVIPNARLLITNTGNARTPFRLRAEDPSGANKYHFYVQGQQLLAPAAMFVGATAAPAGSPAPASNGAAAPAVYAPTMVPAAAPWTPPPAAVSAPVPASAAAAPSAQQPAAAQPQQGGVAAAGGAVAEGVQQVAGFGRGLFGALGQVLPGQAGAAAQKASMKVAGTEARMASAQWQAADTASDLGDVKGFVTPAGRPAAAPAPSAPPPAAPPYAATAASAPPPAAPSWAPPAFAAAQPATGYAPPVAPPSTAPARPGYAPPAAPPPFGASTGPQASTSSYASPVAYASAPIAAPAGATASGGASIAPPPMNAAAASVPPGYPAPPGEHRPAAPPGYPSPLNTRPAAAPPGYPAGTERSLPAAPPGYGAVARAPSVPVVEAASGSAPASASGGAAGSAGPAAGTGAPLPRNPLLGRTAGRTGTDAASEATPSQYSLSESPGRSAVATSAPSVSLAGPTTPGAPATSSVTSAPLAPAPQPQGAKPAQQTLSATAKAAALPVGAAVVAAPAAVPPAAAAKSPGAQPPTAPTRNPLTAGARSGTTTAAPLPGQADPRFALRSESGAPVISARGLAWVETPPLGPGETIGVDLQVVPAGRGRTRGRRVEFSVYSMAAADLSGVMKEWRVSVVVGGK